LSIGPSYCGGIEQDPNNNPNPNNNTNFFIS